MKFYAWKTSLALMKKCLSQPYVLLIIFLQLLSKNCIHKYSSNKAKEILIKQKHVIRPISHVNEETLQRP